MMRLYAGAVCCHARCNRRAPALTCDRHPVGRRCGGSQRLEWHMTCMRAERCHGFEAWLQGACSYDSLPVGDGGAAGRIGTGAGEGAASYREADGGPDERRCTRMTPSIALTFSRYDDDDDND